MMQNLIHKTNTYKSIVNPGHSCHHLNHLLRRLFGHAPCQSRADITDTHILYIYNQLALCLCSKLLSLQWK